MADFIATVSPDAPGNWGICKRKKLWGVIEKHGSSTGAANGRRVRSGDRIFIWLGKPKRGNAPHGLAALVEATGDYRPVRSRAEAPWPHPEDYAGIFPIEVIVELGTPVPDRFPGPERVGVRFGIQNMALIHGFRAVTPEVAARLIAALGGRPPS